MKTSFLLIALLTSQLLFAQSTQTKKQQHRTKILQLVKENSGFQTPSNKTRGGARLVATSRGYATSPTPPTYDLGDSTHYYYKSAYGYDPTPALFNNYVDLGTFYENYKHYFDSSYSWTYNFGTSSYDPTDSTHCLFDANHNRTKEYINYLSFGGYSVVDLTFNAANLVSTEIDTIGFSTPADVVKYTSTYNAQNKIIVYETQIWDASTLAWVPDTRDSFFYDFNNNVASAKEYTYNGASWDPSQLIDLTYNGAGTQLLVVSIKAYSGGTWVNDYRSDYTYNGSNQLTRAVNASWNVSAWLNQDKDSLIYGTSTYPTTRLTYTWNGSAWEGSIRYDYTFTAANQVSEQKISYWNIGTLGWDLSEHTLYYYENYTPQAVTETTVSNDALNLYPVPATETLQLNIHLDKKQSAKVHICDVSGKTIKTLSLAVGNTWNQKISIADLPAGIYMLTLRGEYSVMNRKFVKQ